jgi:hypothetical protein
MRRGLWKGGGGRFAVALVVVLLLVAPATVSAATVLFTTQEDFAEWSGNNPGAESAAGDTDALAVNGLGNPSAAGGAGTPGALTISIVGGFDQTYSPGEQGNAPFIALMRELSDTPGATIALDYVAPSGITSYWQPLLHFNYDGFWGGIAPASTLDNGTFQTALYDISSLTIPATLTYFQVGLTSNNGTEEAGKTFTIDAMRVVPEPGALAWVSLLGVGALRRRHRRAPGR